MAENKISPNTNNGISIYTDLDELLNLFSNTLRSHSRRVAVCSAIIAEYADEFLGLYDFNGTGLAASIHLGGTCHDIGKLVLPSLTVSEEDYLRHPVCGAELLESNKDKLFSDEAQAKLVLEMVHYHHERADGKGFPQGFKANDIPLPAAICAIANELDHLMYAGSGVRKADGDIKNSIKLQTGSVFSECVVTFLMQAWARLTEKYADWNRFVM